MSDKTNPIIAIILLTVMIKLCCLPIYTIRYKNSCVKDSIRKYINTIEKKEERKRKRKIISNLLDVKKWTFSFSLYVIEIFVIILFLRAIESLANNIFWFNINLIDTTNILSYIYLIVLILVEIVGIQKNASKLELVMQLIISFIVVILMYKTSKTVVSGVVIYWCASSIYTVILRRFLLENTIKKKIEKEYNTNYLENMILDLQEG